MKRFYMIILVAFLFVTVAQAKTPDGETPVNENVCDPLLESTVTPGLYGLCVAFCEALDCDTDYPDPTQIQAQCRTADPKILEKYNQIKKESDPPMPCVMSECPCWTPEEMAAIGSTFSPNSLYAAMWYFSSYTTYSLLESLVITPGNPYGGYQYGQVYLWPNDTYECVYAYGYFGPGGDYFLRYFEISEQEALVCREQIIGQYQSLVENGQSVPCGGNLCP